MKVFTILRKIWYWSYERGSWQYDVMCVAILAFIFLIPARVFDDPEASPRWEGTLKETDVPADTVRDGSIEALSAALGGAEVHRVQVLRTQDGRIRAYRVWVRVPPN
jgi:hypothetical protein